MDEARILVEQSIPLYVRGKKKGQRKGTGSVTVCERGGWLHNQSSDGGRVVLPGTILGVWLGIANQWESTTFLKAGKN